MLGLFPLPVTRLNSALVKLIHKNVEVISFFVNNAGPSISYNYRRSPDGLGSLVAPKKTQKSRNQTDTKGKHLRVYCLKFDSTSLIGI